jgi:hypothetical protein
MTTSKGSTFNRRQGVRFQPSLTARPRRGTTAPRHDRAHPVQRRGWTFTRSHCKSQQLSHGWQLRQASLTAPYLGRQIRVPRQHAQNGDHCAEQEQTERGCRS